MDTVVAKGYMTLYTWIVLLIKDSSLCFFLLNSAVSY